VSIGVATVAVDEVKLVRTQMEMCNELFLKIRRFEAWILSLHAASAI